MSIASEISRLQQAKEDLATAIGNKGVTVSVSATLDDFADYVDDIVTGITPTGTKSITTNGTHDVTNYASASVAVPASAVDSGTKSITTNGTHDVVGYASANVNVPSSGIDTSDATATANDILSGKTAYVNGSKITGSITSKTAQTYTPTTRPQTISSGQYLSGTQTILGDANLVSANIASGVSIFGVAGSHSGANIQSLSVTANGTYNAPNGVDGYNPVYVSVPSAGAITCTLSISDDGIVASNFSSGTAPANYVAVGHDEINNLWVTYCTDEYGHFSIAWFDPDGLYVFSYTDYFPTLVNTADSADTSIYSAYFSDTSFTATVVE